MSGAFRGQNEQIEQSIPRHLYRIYFFGGYVCVYDRRIYIFYHAVLPGEELEQPRFRFIAPCWIAEWSLHSTDSRTRYFYDFFRAIGKLVTGQSGQIEIFQFLFFLRGHVNGHRVFAVNSGVLCGGRVVDHRLRSIEGTIMSWIYLVSGGLTLAVFVYLVVALFYPEKF